MIPAPPDLSDGLARLATRALGRQASYRADTLSTMTDAADWAAAGARHGALVLADHQSGGQGRQGRTWAAAPGQNLLVSIVWRRGTPEAWPRLLLGAAVGVADALGALGLDARLKWPNDVRLATPEGPRKVAGLIARAVGPRAPDAVVLGLGLNVNQTAFPAEVAPVATSLALAAGRAWDRGEVLAALLDALEPRLDAATAEAGAERAALFDAYTARLDGLGSPVVLHTGTGVRAGTFARVDPDGALVLRRPDGATERHLAGDVHVARPTAAPTP